MPTDYQTYSDVVVGSFVNMWTGFLSVVPNILGAILLFVFGWIVALALEQVVTKVLKALKFEKVFARLGWTEALERVDMHFDAPKFLGAVVRWFVVLAFLLAATDLLRLDAFTSFLRDVLGYIPNIAVAALIILFAAIIGDFFDRVVIAAVRGAGFAYAKLVGAVVKWSILVFAFLAALVQLQVAPTLIQTLFTGFVAMIAIAGGLAFGLGGKEFAAEVMARVRSRMMEGR